MKLAALLALFLLAASSACTRVRAPVGERRDVAPKEGGMLRLANFADVRNLEPSTAFDTVASAVQVLLFDRLVDYDREGHIVPLLAERFDVSPDGRRVTFELREGVLFHDGSELTAADVKRSIERALHHDTPCPVPSFYQSIVGYDAFHNGTKEGDGRLTYAPHLAGVVSDGRYVLHIDLTEPDATFLPAMTLFFMAPVCPGAGATYSPEWGKRVCGTGPFRLEQWLPSRQIDVVRHQGYFQKGKPYLDRVRFHLLMPALTQRFKFEDADLDQIRDLSVIDSITYRRDPRWRSFGVWEPAKTTIGTFFNTQMKPFDNVELRRAFAAAVDWQQLASLRPEEILPASQMIPPAISIHDPTFVGQKHDLAAALQHMKNAGYPYDAASETGGYPIPVRYLVNAESLPSDALAPVMMQQLSRIGIRMEIKSVSWPTYLAESAKRNAAQLGYVSWVMDFPDPSDYFEPTLSSEAIQGEETRNVAFYSNPELDRLLKQAHSELDPARRAALYRRCEEIVRDEAPWSLGLHQRFYEVVQPYVHGFVTDNAHARDVRWVWVDQEERSRAGRSLGAHSVLALLRPWGRPPRAPAVSGERR